jgi:hypothetical protein
MSVVSPTPDIASVPSALWKWARLAGSCLPALGPHRSEAHTDVEQSPSLIPPLPLARLCPLSVIHPMSPAVAAAAAEPRTTGSESLRLQPCVQSQKDGVERDGRHRPEHRPIRRQRLASLVLAHVLRLAPRWCRWRKEERTVTLDFGCDESCDRPDMRGSSVILVNLHVIGQCNRHLLRQYRNEGWVAGCDESRQHAKTTSRQSCVELRQNVRAPDAGFDIGSDRLGEYSRQGHAIAADCPVTPTRSWKSEPSP